MHINIDTFEETSLVFGLLSDCIDVNIEEYSILLSKTPKEILTLRDNTKAFSKLLDTYDKEVKKIKVKLGESAQKDDINSEFNKEISKVYGKQPVQSITVAMKKITDSMAVLKIGQATVTAQ